jgi:7-cyano-7-deazaguanine synthase
MSKSVILLSGGMDSATLAAYALKHDKVETLIPISISYGSKHNPAERHAARNVAGYYRLGLVELDLPAHLFRGGSSALMGDAPMPYMTYQEIEQAKGPSPTVVPFRNANLISIATALAVTSGADQVYIAAHAEDARNWAYPDCTPEFLGAMANAVYIGTYQQVRLRFPFIWSTKAQIVSAGERFGVPFKLTYSCYEGGLVHCGRCPTCVERKQAFVEAGVLDPTTYEPV